MINFTLSPHFVFLPVRHHRLQHHNHTYPRIYSGYILNLRHDSEDIVNIHDHSQKIYSNIILTIDYILYSRYSNIF